MCERKCIQNAVCDVFSECENRMSIHFCLCVVSKESVVIVMDDEIFFGRCLTVDFTCRY